MTNKSNDDDEAGKKTRFQENNTANLGVNVFFRLTSFGPLASYQ